MVARSGHATSNGLQGLRADMVKADTHEAKSMPLGAPRGGREIGIDPILGSPDGRIVSRQRQRGGRPKDQLRRGEEVGEKAATLVMFTVTSGGCTELRHTKAQQ
ncbi:hypothetical protein NDU88_004469 [Pleurodeles waltl]|uniref:Uncharacterized protein n=1 Tax=Pleurodeles waltl TaxID=8319 RepID=A0AAV7W526_PLEWA|nr:hypothetical protein NDU88_004469 [Pleurodeles waltl]